MKYITSFSNFIFEYHHMLSNENSLDALCDDLIVFVQWQMKHSSNKKKLYDKKKYVYYYKWKYDEILKWFAGNNKVLRIPAFLIENGSTISVSISLARMVKGRRKEHSTMELIRVNGNNLAAHGVTTDSSTNMKNHNIFLNTYKLANDNNMDVQSFVMSDKFKESFAGSIKHEFMHAFDRYKIGQATQHMSESMISAYKKYRSKNSIAKEWVTFKKYGEWNDRKFDLNENVINAENGLRTFIYMTLYYIKDSEMNAYIQTFNTQIMKSEELDIYDSEIFRRYKFIEFMFNKEFSEKQIKDAMNENTVKDFSEILKAKIDDPMKLYEKYKKIALTKTKKEITRFYKVFSDLKERKNTEKTDI